jgi:hypothetical protein
MHLPRERVAGVRIGRLCRPNHTSGNIPFEGPSLDAGKGFPDIEAEAGVE